MYQDPRIEVIAMIRGGSLEDLWALIIVTYVYFWQVHQSPQWLGLDIG